MPQTPEDAPTEMIPAAETGDGLAGTRELPAIGDQPPTEAVAPPPTEAVAPPPTEAVPAPPPPPVRGHEPALGGVRGRWVPWAALVAVLAVVAAFVALVRPGAGDDDEKAGPTATSAAAVAIPAQVSSVDPSGGSGLRREGDRWRTQSYNSAEFGNLKDGVGLLLDLGAPHAVGTVTLDVEGPLAIELRAGDGPATDGGAFQQVSAAPNASGDTRLDGAKGGEHRYWLVWVTRLANADGGFRAVLGNPVVRGPAQ